jgi:DNA-binding transcriptional LysR family regulator
MEIRQLRFFLSTIRLGSVKDAAREHFVTQPAVSIQLKQLEQQLGARLYERQGRRIVATQAGAALASEIEDILQRVDRLPAVATGFVTLERGELRLGTIDAASVYVLPGLFRSFRSKYPGVDIRVEVADSDSLLAALESNAIELAIVTLPLHGHDFEVVPFFEDTMVLVAHAKHTLVAKGLRGKRALEAVADSGLITYPAQSTTRRQIERVFIENGIDFRPAMEMSSPEAIKRLAESGLGAAILPNKVVSLEVRRGTLKAVPTGRIGFSRTLGIVYRNEESLSQPAKVFLTMLLDKHKGSTKSQ